MHVADEVLVKGTSEAVVILEIQRTEQGIMAYVENEQCACRWVNLRDLKEG